MKVNDASVQKLLWVALGMVIMFLISFWAIYSEQPRAINCERAANVCGLSGSGGSGGSSGGYAECDSCCPDPDNTPADDCTGRLVPESYGSVQTSADSFCSNYVCESGEYCRAVRHDGSIVQTSWFECACEGPACDAGSLACY